MARRRPRHPRGRRGGPTRGGHHRRHRHRGTRRPPHRLPQRRRPWTGTRLTFGRAASEAQGAGPTRGHPYSSAPPAGVPRSPFPRPTLQRPHPAGSKHKRGEGAARLAPTPPPSPRKKECTKSNRPRMADTLTRSHPPKRQRRRETGKGRGQVDRQAPTGAGQHCPKGKGTIPFPRGTPNTGGQKGCNVRRARRLAKAGRKQKKNKKNSDTVQSPLDKAAPRGKG